MREEGGGGPYTVAPIPVAEATPGNIAELLNAAANEGWELVTALPPVMSPGPSESTEPAAYLLILRKTE